MLELAIFILLISLLTMALLSICSSYCEEEMTYKDRIRFERQRQKLLNPPPHKISRSRSLPAARREKREFMFAR